MLPDLFVQPNDFAHDVFVLHGGVFARLTLLFQTEAGLARLCSRNWRLHSWDSGILSFI